MIGNWTANVSDLKALTEFLEGLADLSNRTGVKACIYGGTEIEIPGGAVLRLNSQDGDHGQISYRVDEYAD